MSSTLRTLALAALAFAAGCASESSSKFCPTTGIVCPEDMICAAAQPVCLISTCGNGQIDGAEQCDDGNIIDGDRCSSLCRTEDCGNGILDEGEECDPAPGNIEPGDGCSQNCTIEICGNGTTDFGEACDDGNFDNGDGCSGMAVELPDGQGGTVSSPGACASNEICGNGKVDYQVGEVCDDGNVISEDGCNSDCRSGTGCGNGIRELDEECDDGDDDDTNRCLNDCTLSMCGDGVIEAGRETCDAGNRDDRFAVETADCNIDCTISTCGDRRVNLTDDEECDAGVFENSDNANCTLECKFNFCGDGKEDQQAPNIEACDDGNDNPSDGCNNSCQLASCGNSTIDSGEECDDGDLPGSPNNNDACVQCKTAICGDGWVRTGVEDCDGNGEGVGDTLPGDGCSPLCKFEICGNSVVDPGETCDDGDAPVTDPPSTVATPGPTLPENADACVNSTVVRCQNARCGDGYLRTGVEDCDDGNNDDGDGCSATCKNEGCGNGILETVRGEQCDDGGTVGGDGCSATCLLEDCGDGVIDVGEECDGTGTMTTPGVGGETATCNVDCTLVECGDGKINNTAMEQCDDGTEIIGGLPVNQNQDNRDCRSDCRLNFCTDGFQNTDGSPGKIEACDDGNTVNNDECSNTCQLADCGDGLLDLTEECDLGAANSDTGACTLGCKIAVCGDNKVRIGVEECDTGSSLSNNGPCLKGTGPNNLGGCRFARCGDGSIQALSRNDAQASIDETCDNGAANIPSGATPSCAYGVQSCSFCSAVSCDPVVVNDPARTSYCGDGTPDAGEEACDRGFLLNGSTVCAWGLNATTGCALCSSDCDTPSTGTPHFCGDGVLDTASSPWGGNETCDFGTGPGAGKNGDPAPCPYGMSCARCSNTCTASMLTGPYCGDGIVNGGESCDDGDAMGGDGCSATCTQEPGYACTGTSCVTTCGDGVKAGLEVCDDGDTMGGDGCSGNCMTLEPGFTCNVVGNLTVCTHDPVCGDGIVEGGEMCDYGAADNNGIDCGPGQGPPAYGASNACVACTAVTCMAVVSVDYCGDGAVNGTEQCDGAMFGTTTCTSLGYDGGTLTTCTASCTADVSTCTECGNGLVEAGEACDDDDEVNGDGCSMTCAIEAGWECDMAEPSVCGCNDDSGCGALFFCDGSPGSPGTCMPDGANGAACEDNAECLSNNCAAMVCAAPPP